MAGLGGKNWTFQEEVTSSDVNGYLADQVVMRFADSTARTAGFGGAGEPTLAEGMVSYLDDANRVDVYNGSAWKPVSQILQVVQTVKTDTFSTTSTSFTDVTGMSVSITPSSTSNKILVLLDVKTSGANAWQFKILRGATDIYVGDAAGSRTQGAFQGTDLGGANIIYWGSTFLDSPATTSSTTYKIQMKTEIGTNAHLNRSNTDTNTAALGMRTASSITVMEIAG